MIIIVKYMRKADNQMARGIKRAHRHVIMAVSASQIRLILATDLLVKSSTDMPIKLSIRREVTLINVLYLPETSIDTRVGYCDATCLSVYTITQ